MNKRYIAVFMMIYWVGLSPGSALAQEAMTAQAPAWFKQADKNADGKLSRDEAPNKEVFGDVDTDQDGFASLSEVNAWLSTRPASNLSPNNQPPQARQDRAQLPDDVEKRSVTIWSDGTRMAGDLYLPKNRDAKDKFPAIVLCAGTGGTKGGTQARVAPIFAANGFVVLAFDYRGWGESESQLMAVEAQPKPDANNEMSIKVKALRWQMNYTDQTEDVRAAISFLAGEPNVDKDKIGLWGSSYGGGLVTTMATLDPRVKCVAAQVPGMGGRSPKAVSAALDLATKQARGEIEPVPIETGKMTGKMERYSNMRVNPAKSVGFNAVESAPQIKSPIIFIVAENEELSNNDTVEAVHKGLVERGVPSAYHVIKGITHYGIYREGFDEATKLEVAFFQKHLQGKSEVDSASGNSASEKPLLESQKVDAPDQNKPDQNKPAANGPARGVGPEAAFRFLDADKDGQLSEAELGKLKQTVAAFRNNPQALSQLFERLDANGDGTLSLEEYKKIGELQPRRATQNQIKSIDKADTEKEDEQKAPAEPDQASKPVKLNEAAQLAHFEKNIRPVLVAQCYQCHSAENNKIKGGLALDTRDATLAGGDSGQAVVPGDATKSLLIAAIKHTDGLEMPPKKKLTDKQINDFVLWIDSGAIDPRESKGESQSLPTKKTKSTDHWAYKQPSLPVIPTVADQNWATTEIDRFIAIGHEKGGVKRNGDATPEVLVRRLYFDLTGLPPTPQDVKTFVELCSKDRQQAIQSTVDRLLSSERFGERWGRHWLDVARFAESSGKETNFSYPHAWRYRDYVIDSFNRDVPFDQFIREQLAGDLLPANDDQRRAELMVATGFLALGSKSHIERNKKQFELDVVDEQIDTVTQAFMGVTVACARCHDHKFDPIPQSDYYAMAGIFRSTETLYGTIPVIQNNNPSQLVSLPASAHVAINADRLTDTARQSLEKQVNELRQKRLELTRKKQFASSEFVQSGILLATLEAKLKAYEADGTPKKLAMGVRDRSKARDSELFIRGEVDKPGEVVPRGFVSVLCSTQPKLPSESSGRLELADWIASKDNPLTARVMVNRVWQHLFGRGLVDTPDNFGVSGSNPSHPELLDYLALTFIEEDKWSVKSLIRRIVSGRVYQLDSASNPENFVLDPDNKLLWRVPPRKLDAEEIRDSMLLVSGVLELERPIGSVVATGGEGYTGGIERFGLLSESKFKCRSVYLPVIRGRAFESMDVFDGVDGSMVVGKRDQTTVPTQSLYLLNSPYVMDLATSAAKRVTGEERLPKDRVRWIYKVMLGREPSAQEVESALAFIDKAKAQSVPTGRLVSRLRGPSAEQTAWAACCQSVWASGEFLVRK